LEEFELRMLAAIQKHSEYLNLAWMYAANDLPTEGMVNFKKQTASEIQCFEFCKST